MKLSKSCLSIAATLSVACASAARSDTVVLPDIDITTDAPSAPSSAPAAAAPSATPGFLQDLTPANNTRIDAAQITRTGSPFVTETLERLVPSVTLTAPSGNPFRLTLNIAVSSLPRSPARRRASPSIRTACASTKPSATR